MALTGRALSIAKDQERRARLPKPKPEPMVAGVSTSSPLNAAQIGGASGLGFEDAPTQETVSTITKNAGDAGYAKSEAGDFSQGRPSAPKTLSGAESASFLKSFGLAGLMPDGSLKGLTQSEANRRGLEERQRRLGMVSPNTSYTFNPETLKGTKKLVDRLGLALNDINNDPFSGVGTKNQKVKSAIDAATRDFAKLFSSPDEFRQAVQFEPKFAETLASLEKMGATASGIEDAIPTVQPTPTQIDSSRQQAVQGLISQGVTDPNQMLNFLNFDESGRQVGDFTMSEVQAYMQGGNGTQSTSDYLASLRNPQANKTAEDRAVNELIPERDLTQQEIARQARIPDQYRELYFGSEEQMGTYTMKVEQAREEVRILNEQENDDKASLRMKANTASARRKAEAKIEEAELEQNRLAAKNYMTGMLAKLGALNTTGAAVKALATLESKYSIATQKLKVAAKYDVQSIEDNLFESINNVETDTADKILKLEEDLTRDYEDISKDILKLEQDADKEIFNLTNKFAEKLRTRTTYHTNELKKEAEKYLKEFQKNAGTADLFALSETVDGKLGPASKKGAMDVSYAKIKKDLKANLPANVASKIIAELTDEELQIFTNDYLAERNASQQSIDPLTFFEQWKKDNLPDDNEDDEFSDF